MGRLIINDFYFDSLIDKIVSLHRLLNVNTTLDITSRNVQDLIYRHVFNRTDKILHTYRRSLVEYIQHRGGIDQFRNTLPCLLNGPLALAAYLSCPGLSKYNRYRYSIVDRSSLTVKICQQIACEVLQDNVQPEDYKIIRNWTQRKYMSKEIVDNIFKLYNILGSYVDFDDEGEERNVEVSQLNECVPDGETIRSALAQFNIKGRVITAVSAESDGKDCMVNYVSMSKRMKFLPSTQRSCLTLKKVKCTLKQVVQSCGILEEKLDSFCNKANMKRLPQDVQSSMNEVEYLYKNCDKLCKLLLNKIEYLVKYFDQNKDTLEAESSQSEVLNKKTKKRKINDSEKENLSHYKDNTLEDHALEKNKKVKYTNDNSRSKCECKKGHCKCRFKGWRKKIKNTVTVPVDVNIKNVNSTKDTTSLNGDSLLSIDLVSPALNGQLEESTSKIMISSPVKTPSNEKFASACLDKTSEDAEKISEKNLNKFSSPTFKRQLEEATNPLVILHKMKLDKNSASEVSSTTHSKTSETLEKVGDKISVGVCSPAKKNRSITPTSDTVVNLSVSPQVQSEYDGQLHVPVFQDDNEINVKLQPQKGSKIKKGRATKTKLSEKEQQDVVLCPWRGIHWPAQRYYVNKTEYIRWLGEKKGKKYAHSKCVAINLNLLQQSLSRCKQKYPALLTNLKSAIDETTELKKKCVKTTSYT